MEIPTLKMIRQGLVSFRKQHRDKETKKNFIIFFVKLGNVCSPKLCMKDMHHMQQKLDHNEACQWERMTDGHWWPMAELAEHGLLHPGAQPMFRTTRWRCRAACGSLPGQCVTPQRGHRKQREMRKCSDLQETVSLGSWMEEELWRLAALWLPIFLSCSDLRTTPSDKIHY